MADPDTFFSGNRYVEALSAAWFWQTHVGITASDTVSWTDSSRPQFQTTIVNGKEKTTYVYGSSKYTDVTSVKINSADITSFTRRFNYWRNAVKFASDKGNPYEDMRSALARLGITTNGAQGYNHQFGITVFPGQPLAIGNTANQLLTVTGSTAESPITPLLDTMAAPLVTDTAPPSQGDIMFISPPSSPPSVVATTSLQRHAVGQCEVQDSGLGALHNAYGLSPITIAETFFKDFDFHDAQIKILTSPKHGVLESAPVDAPNQPFPAAHAENTTYVANEGYVGHDKFSVRVWDKKYDVTIYYDVQSFDGLPSLDIANDNPWCDGHPNFGSFKISASGMESSPLHNANPANVDLQFSDLPGVAVGLGML